MVEGSSGTLRTGEVSSAVLPTLQAFSKVSPLGSLLWFVIGGEFVVLVDDASCTFDVDKPFSATNKKVISHYRAIHNLQQNYHTGLLMNCSFGRKVGVSWSKPFDTPRNSNPRNWINHRRLNPLSSG